MVSNSSNGPVASQELQLLIERVERLEEEKKAIADEIKDVYSDAKGRGFDTKTIKEIVKLRKLSDDERREREALLDTYKAALGMLDGTPLGRWAVERLNKPKPGDQPDPPPPPSLDAEAGPQEPEEEPAPEPTLDEAHIMGTQAARDGQPVTSNPFPAFDERRAAWDESWCAELGSDGMEIPEALRPAPKPKKPDAEA